MLGHTSQKDGEIYSTGYLTCIDTYCYGGGWLTALTLMVFVLIYVPCVAVLAVIKRETGSWKWVGFSVLYLTALAYAVAGLTRLIGSLWL